MQNIQVTSTNSPVEIIIFGIFFKLNLLFEGSCVGKLTAPKGAKVERTSFHGLVNYLLKLLLTEKLMHCTFSVGLLIVLKHVDQVKKSF